MKRLLLSTVALIAGLGAFGSAGIAQDHDDWVPGGATGADPRPAGHYVPAPARTSAESKGPFRKLVIRGVTLIDGTGAPPRGPMDIVIEGNRITAVTQAGWPGLPMKQQREPRDADYELDATGMYVLPGFVDTHTHLPASDKAPDISYAYKLWLAHGVTTVRGVPLAPPDLASSEKSRSAANETAAPRIFNYQTLGAGWTGGAIDSTDKARAWVRWAATHNIDGIKFFNRPEETPAIIAAAIDEAHKNKMGTLAHLSQTGVANFNARDAGDAHLDTVTCGSEEIADTQLAIARYVGRNGLPDALLGGNDQMGCAALTWAQDRNFAVPGDVRVTGCNGFAFIDYVRPRLTSVASPAYEMGKQGAAMLLQRLSDGRFKERQMLFDVTLVPGESD